MVSALEKAHETKVESLQSRVALLEKAQETILESFQSRVAVLEMRLEEANIRITKLEAAAMEAAVPAATSQGASGSSEMPDGLPLLPAAAPPPTSQGANSNSDPEAAGCISHVDWDCKLHLPRIDCKLHLPR